MTDNSEQLQATGSSLVPAHWFRRLVNYLIDMPIALVASVFCMLMVSAIAGAVSNDKIPEKTLEYLGGGAFLLTFAAYFALPELLFGRTLGKLVTGTKAVMDNGSKLTFDAAVSRAAIRMINIEVFSFVGKKTPVGWHDKVAKSIVITVR